MKIMNRKHYHTVMLKTALFFTCFMLFLYILLLNIFANKPNFDIEDQLQFERELLERYRRNTSSSFAARHKNLPEVMMQKHSKIHLPLIFIGGYPRSGSRVIKSLIERHGNVYCNSHAYVMTDALKAKAKWEGSGKETMRLNEAGVDDAVLFSGFSAFMRELVFGQTHGSNNPGGLLCIHEPLTYKYAVYLNKIFPASKFVFVIRDGRAVVRSLKLKEPEKDDFDFSSNGYQTWAENILELLNQCKGLGLSKCHIVRIEDLFLLPEATSDGLSKFLDIPMSVNSLKLSSLLKETNSDFEFVSGTRRIGLSKDERREIANIATTLEALGYDPKLDATGNFESV